jgi:hypothetical protein
MRTSYESAETLISWPQQQWWTAIFWVVLLLVMSIPQLRAERDQTCKLKGGNQEAEYHCPNNFDAVVAGEGTDRCDGACYASNNTASLINALRDILARRFGEEIPPAGLMPLARRLQKEGFVRVRKSDWFAVESTEPQEAVPIRIRTGATEEKGRR